MATPNYDAFDLNTVQNGWDVFDANGDKVGDVHAVTSSYLTVSKGFLFPTERYIPLGDIQGTRNDRVYLSVTKDQLEQEGWDQPPTATTGTTGTMGSTGAGMTGGDRTVELREQELAAE